jgi:crotonobetaine/carnitine-CoA ligase
MNTATPETFAQLLQERARTHPDFRILTFVDEASGETETRTFDQLLENAGRLATYLQENGFTAGDRFGVLLANHPQIVEALTAASLIGAVMVPIDPRTRGDKLAFILGDSQCRGIICADYNRDNVDQVLEDAPVEWVMCLGQQYENEMMRLAVHAGDPEVNATSPLQVLYTSGTTGDPKGILKFNAELLTVAGALPVVMGIQPDDVLYSGLSLTHGNAQVFTLGAALGAVVPAVFSRKFTKSRMWQTIRNHSCTVFTLLGGMTTAIYSEPEKPDDADNPVRLVVSAGMPQAIWEDFARRFDVTLFEVYGTAEGGLFWNDGSGPVGSFGNINNTLLHSSRVVDELGNDCAPGQMGELIWQHSSGAQVSVSYLNKPEASAAKTEGGWFRTGDIVHADADGWLFFDYRAGGGIRRNGDFINPGFVEKVIAEHPAVNDVFVYGVPSKNGVPGEKDVVAAIVPAAGGDFPAEDVFASCLGKLEANFIPSYLQLLEEIPKTASEKPQERFLLERFAVDAQGVYCA